MNHDDSAAKALPQPGCAVSSHDRVTRDGTEPRDVAVEFVASDAAPADLARPRQRVVLFLPVLAALVLGVCVGRVSAPMPIASPRPQAQPAGSVPGCHRQHTCVVRQTRIPLLATLVGTDFPDVLSVEVTATDDVDTGRRDRIQLTSRLARGLAITATAQYAQHPTSTAWVFVARGAQPTYAERVMLVGGIHSAFVRVRIARCSVGIHRLGRGDLVPTGSPATGTRTNDGAILARMGSSEPQLNYLLGLGLHAAAGSQAVSWLG